MLAVNIPALLQRHPLFGQLPEPSRLLLSASMQQRTLQKGQFLFQQDQAFCGLYLLVYGAIALQSNARRAKRCEGSARVVDLVLPGRVFGVTDALSGQRSLCALACQACLLIQLPSLALHAEIDRNSTFSRLLIGLTAEKLARCRKHALDLAVHSTQERLLGFLLSLAEQQTSPQDVERVIRLPTSKREIASYLNMAQSQLSRNLSLLMERDLIEISAREIRIINLNRLRSLAARAAY